MRQTLSFITLGVRDLAISRAFYARLGWRESPASKAEIAFYQVGSVAFGLFQRTALADDAGVPDAGSGFSGFTLAHNVESEAAVRQTLADACSAGGRLVKAAENVFWGGYRGYFADPDGFLWEICFNPFFPLDAAGHIQWPATALPPADD